VKKAALEQMAVMLGERKEETGRNFFRGKSWKDVFSMVVEQVQEMRKLMKTVGVDGLHPKEIGYLKELIRVLILAILGYMDEPVVNVMVKTENAYNNEDTPLGKLIETMNVCVGSKQIEVRKASLRLLQILLTIDHIKICLDVNTGMPYLSIPTYMAKTYHFLFPTVNNFLTNRKPIAIQSSPKSTY
jgi:hypothetical protein